MTIDQRIYGRADWPQELATLAEVTPDLPLTLQHLRPAVTVVGDVMLDGWWVGRTERMSREAPAPVVEVTERRYSPGGAANTAMNLAALGAAVRMVGVVGEDDAGRMLRDLLADAGVDVRGLVLADGVTTVAKNRILSDGQILLRVDELHDTPYPPAVLELLARTAVEKLEDADALLVCDYGSGALLGPVLDALKAAERPSLTVVDAHDPTPWAALRPDLVTPNAAEAFQMLGRAAVKDGTRVEVLADAADQLHARSGAAAVVVTLDRDGTLVLEPDGSAHRTYAEPVAEMQAAGAGDTFVAALTLARSVNLALPVSAQLAQSAADVVVHRFGTSVCSTQDLVEQLGRGLDVTLDPDELLRRVNRDRAAGRRIVMTNGCFDVLHRGHTTYLASAAQLGDVLVVAINSDESVRRLKGPDRPINSAADRASVLAALSCVDYVTVFDSDTATPVLERLRPDVYTKGGDYTPEMLEETVAVRAYGGEVQIMEYVSAHSTSAVVQRIRGGAATPP
jgi:D-beta-D-heptose 7-phosphate kinase/D-beta-D-heptose 1-phosphate adenosyltransferase